MLYLFWECFVNAVSQQLSPSRSWTLVLTQRLLSIVCKQSSYFDIMSS